MRYVGSHFGSVTSSKKNQSLESPWIYDQDQKIRWIQHPRQDMKTPLRLLSVYNNTTTQWSTQDILAYTNGKCTSMGKGKDLSRTGCILGKIRY